MNFKWNIALSGACFGMGWLLGGAVPAAAQDRPAGNNDNNVRRSETPKKESRPNKDQKKDGPMVQTVLIFPPDTPSPAGIADQLTDTVTRVVQRRLDFSKKYHSVYFLRSMPTVRRAINDGAVTAIDTDRPFNPLKAKKLSQLTGYNTVFMTDINGYSFDADKHQATLSLTLTLIDYSGSKPITRSAGEEMVSSDKEPKSATEITVAMDVARDLTEKLMTELFKPKPAASVTPDAADKTDAPANPAPPAAPDKPNPAK